MKVAIIGAGLQGITCAYFLAKRGCQVVVIDRCSGAGLETSFANGGMPTPSQAGPWNEPEIFLKLLKYLGRESSPLLIRPLALPGMMHWGLQFLRNSKPQHYFRNIWQHRPTYALQFDDVQKCSEMFGNVERCCES